MIREFQDADLNAVAAIWLETNLKAHDFIPAQYWQDNFAPVKKLLPQAQIYVFEEEAAHQIQGFIGLQGGCIAGIFVSSQAQSRGIGKQLLDAAKRARPELSLKVYQKNARAVRFYQREGFQTAREGVDEDTKEKEYWMVWRAE